MRGVIIIHVSGVHSLDLHVREKISLSGRN